MSRELAQALFQRDLSEAEAGDLEASLERDPAVAEALFAAAEAQYRATGLPEPRWAERRASRNKGLWLLGALAIAGGVWLYASRPHGPELSTIGEDSRSLPVVELSAASFSVEEAPAEADRAPVAASAAAPHRQGQRLGLVLRLRGDTPLDVMVLAPSAAPCRHLFHGTLPAGEQRLEWDGLDDEGRRAEAGRYTVKVHGPGIELSRELRLGR